MSDPDAPKSCTRCGKCCTEEGGYMGNLTATAEDVLRWMDEGRTDILKWTAIFYDDDDMPIWADLWVHEDTGEERERCPFVKKDPGQQTYTCTIYETRPTTCREYRPWSVPGMCKEVAVPVSKIRRATAAKVIKHEKRTERRSL